MTWLRLLVGTLALLITAAAPLPTGWPEAPSVTAEAFVLVDARTGQTLAEAAADQPRPVASTVKILTALTVRGRADGSELVTVGPEVVGLEGASVGLRPGDRWTVRELLAGLLVRSGNDAAAALAVHVGGSVTGFVQLMREEAARLGLDDVVLVSPSGLEDANRLSARDLAALTRAALEDGVLAELVASRDVALPTDENAPTRNELLGTYAGATGVKTGYTAASGWSVVGSAERDGRTLIAVVLGASGAAQRFSDAAALLDHGFARFEPVSASRRIRLRIAAGDLLVTAVAPTVQVPVAGPRPEVQLPFPAEVADLPRAVPVTWRGAELTRAIVTAEGGARPPTDGGGNIARYLADRGYAAMRAATATGSWSR